METSLGRVELSRSEVRGYDLADELLGRVTFTDLAGLILLGSLPTPDRRRMLDAMLISLAEHGLVGSVVAARLVYESSPDAVQGAVAASLLAAGSQHLGSSELVARMLQECLVQRDEDTELSAVAAGLVETTLDAGRRIYGIGHGTHRLGDPRANRLFEIARETDSYGDGCVLMQHIADAVAARLGGYRPINVTGAIGAIATDMGLPWQLGKSFALIGRCLGTLGHIGEEARSPISGELHQLIRQNTQYVGRPADPDAVPGPG